MRHRYGTILPVQVGMNNCNIVIASDNVTKRREAFLDSLDLHRLGQRIAKVLELL